MPLLANRTDAKMQKIFTSLTILGAIAIVTNPLHAQQYWAVSGYRIHKDCNNHNQFLHGICNGYILGAIDAIEVERAKNHQPSCLPPSPTNGQIVNEFTGLMGVASPVYLDFSAFLLVRHVYHELCQLRRR